MAGILSKRLYGLKNSPALLHSLSSVQRGIEKESLRVSPSSELAQSLHPETLGSALTHPKITTDYSEALLEFITPISTSITETLQCLEEIHHYTYQQLDQQQETLWANSMPCILGQADSIPVALYGNSNVGKMKTIYRVGLGYRYGRPMQTISGIHYNFSLPDPFWLPYSELLDNSEDINQFKTKQYFSLMRNFRRYAPLLVYLFGASPILDKSFVQNQSHQLEQFDQDSFYLPYATSLRMGDLGYQSNAQSALFVCYNNLEQYIHTLRKGITKPYPDYEAIGVKGANGEYQQLNTALLQIENEFYSTIRPKRVAASGEAPINALKRGGVEYIEVRCMDVNPFDAVGISAETMRFLDTFLLYCLLEDSPVLLPEACLQTSKNLRAVVNQGRQPDLQLEIDGQSITFTDWANNLLHAMRPIAELLDELTGEQLYSSSWQTQQGKVNNAELTPSAQVLQALQKNKLSYKQFAMQQSQHWHQHFVSKKLPTATRQYFSELAKHSLAQQSSIEQTDAMSFDDYLANYYQQYQE